MQISLVIPTLNRYDSLTTILTNLSTWRTQPREIIIVDQTEGVIGLGDYPDLSDSQRSIRHIKLNAAGPCIARNMGARYAAGDILWFLDDDMYLEPECDLVAYIVQHFTGFPNSVLMGPIDPVSDQIQLNERFDIIRHLTKSWRQGQGEYRLSLGIGAGNVCIPANIFHLLGGFDERFDPNGAFEDRDLGLRCFQNGIPVFQSSAFYVEHRPAPRGGRREKNASQSSNMYYFWSKYFDEDMYYLQVLVYWLSTLHRPLLKNLIRLFVKRYINAPAYNELVTENCD